MSTTQAAASNPFVLMVNPEVVFAAIENSDRLARLASRICRPLDKPAPVLADGEAAAAADDAIDAAAEQAPESDASLDVDQAAFDVDQAA